MSKYNKMNHLIMLLLPIILLSSCSNASKSGGEQAEAIKLFPITRNPDNPTSIFLKLVDKKEGDTSFSYIAKGLYQDDTVGFILEVAKNIPAGINKDGSVNEQDGFKKGLITFKKSGTESDRFVSALAKLWQVGNFGKMKTAPIQPLAFFSNKKPINFNKPSTNSFKLFFNDKSPTPGEIFFTFDTYRRSIEFQEKDAKHRTTIIAAFAGQMQEISDK